MGFVGLNLSELKESCDVRDLTVPWKAGRIADVGIYLSKHLVDYDFAKLSSNNGVVSILVEESEVLQLEQALRSFFVTSTAKAAAPNLQQKGAASSIAHSSPSAPPSAAASALESGAVFVHVVVKLTLHEFHAVYNTKESAKAFVVNKLGEFGGTVRKCLPMSKGRQIKVFLDGVSEAAWNSDIRVKLASVSSKVERFTEEQTNEQKRFDANFKATREAAEKAVGDLNTANSAVTMLAQLRGPLRAACAEPSKKKAKKDRRFSDRGMKFLAKAQAVASVGVKAAASSSSSDDEAMWGAGE